MPQCEQCYFSFEIHFSFSFYKFFIYHFYFYIISVFHKQSFQFLCSVDNIINLIRYVQE